MTDRVRTLARTLEGALGGVELRAIHAAMRRAAGVELARADDVAYAARTGRAARALPIVGIHGFGGDKETWLMTTALLPRRRGVVAIDLLGHGASGDPRGGPITIRRQAEAVLRVLDRAGLERAVICGNSMGGGVALRLAASWPARVAGLVLVASIGRDVHAAGRAWSGTNPLIPRMEDVERFLALVLERPPPVPRAVIRHVVVARARRADTLARLFHDFVHHDGDAGVPHALADLDHPALVVHGDQDRIIDRAVADDLVAALPRAELVVLRGIGHAPQLEAPRTLARLVDAFATRCERGKI